MNDWIHSSSFSLHSSVGHKSRWAWLAYLSLKGKTEVSAGKGCYFQVLRESTSELTHIVGRIHLFGVAGLNIHFFFFSAGVWGLLSAPRDCCQALAHDPLPSQQQNLPQGKSLSCFDFFMLSSSSSSQRKPCF